MAHDDHGANFWERAFVDKQLMWGREPTRSALLARDRFTVARVRTVLVPGVGYGRNALPFLERGMDVTGIETSATAIALARSQLGHDIPIHHGSVTDMPFDDRRYDGIFCYGLLHLLDAPGRAKLLADCARQLAPGGTMIFTAITRTAPMYGRGTRLGDDWYEVLPGVPMYFHDAESIARDFAPHGLVEQTAVDEPAHGGASLPFLLVVCEPR